MVTRPRGVRVGGRWGYSSVSLASCPCPAGEVSRPGGKCFLVMTLPELAPVLLAGWLVLAREVSPQAQCWSPTLALHLCDSSGWSLQGGEVGSG